MVHRFDSHQRISQGGPPPQDFRQQRLLLSQRRAFFASRFQPPRRVIQSTARFQDAQLIFAAKCGHRTQSQLVLTDSKPRIKRCAITGTWVLDAAGGIHSNAYV